MLTDDEIDKLGAGNNYPGTVPGMHKFARAIIAAHTAKLLAGMEMPESKIALEKCHIDGRDNCCRALQCTRKVKLYTTDQLKQYVAACAAQAGMQEVK